MIDADLRSTGPLPGVADAVLNALPLPVIMVAADGKIADANVAAESFFEVSAPLLRQHFPDGPPFRVVEIPLGGGPPAAARPAPTEQREREAAPMA